MAQNFRVRFNRNSDSLHLHLEGEFDGSSASVLANTLASHCNGSGRIVVHTDGLTSLHPFGLAVFQDHLPRMRKGQATVTFTGANRERMAPG
jgi:anti-anti-sigma regulatory factor